MRNLLTPQGITALLTILSMIAALFGRSQLAGFFSDPDTVQTVLGIAALFGIGLQAVLPPVVEPPKS